MDWIILQGPEGIRKVQAGIPYRLLPGEKIIGANPGPDELEELSQETGIGLGDLVKKLVELIPDPIRPKHCSKCEERRQALNRLSELGKDKVKQFLG